MSISFSALSNIFSLFEALMFVVVFRIQAIELSALEKMQEKQKQIEQENKRKKAALQETIKKR